MTKNLSQKNWFKLAAAITVAGSLGIGTYAALTFSSSQSDAIAGDITPEALVVTAFRSPTCGCCGAWLDHMKAAGFKVKDNLVEDMESVKQKHHVSQELAACHTAIVGGYVVEGHIPAADVKRLLAEKPNITGIAVPGMPIGSPGMESGDIREPYMVYSFNQNGDTEIFQEYQS